MLRSLFSYLKLILLVFTLSLPSSAGSPPSNTIPIIADRPNVSEVDLDTFLMLSWHYFNVLQAGDYSAFYFHNKLVGSAEETGMFLSLNPAETAQWGHWPWSWVARMSIHDFSSSTAYARPVWAGITVGTTTYTQDALIDSFTAPTIRDTLQGSAEVMDSIFGSEEQVWFYNTFDEAS